VHVSSCKNVTETLYQPDIDDGPCDNVKEKLFLPDIDDTTWSVLTETLSYSFYFSSNNWFHQLLYSTVGDAGKVDEVPEATEVADGQSLVPKSDNGEVDKEPLLAEHATGRQVTIVCTV